MTPQEGDENGHTAQQYKAETLQESRRRATGETSLFRIWHIRSTMTSLSVKVIQQQASNAPRPIHKQKMSPYMERIHQNIMGCVSLCVLLFAKPKGWYEWLEVREQVHRRTFILPRSFPCLWVGHHQRGVSLRSTQTIRPMTTDCNINTTRNQFRRVSLIWMSFGTQDRELRRLVAQFLIAQARTVLHNVVCLIQSNTGCKERLRKHANPSWNKSWEDI